MFITSLDSFNLRKGMKVTKKHSNESGYARMFD